MLNLNFLESLNFLSAWVAMESINTFYHEKTNTKKNLFKDFQIEDNVQAGHVLSLDPASSDFEKGQKNYFNKE